MPTNKIVFDEPGLLFSETDFEKCLSEAEFPQPFKEKLRSLRAEADELLTQAKIGREELKGVQANCPHPNTLVHNDVKDAAHQCLVCGYRRLRNFGSKPVFEAEDFIAQVEMFPEDEEEAAEETAEKVAEDSPEEEEVVEEDDSEDVPAADK